MWIDTKFADITSQQPGFNESFLLFEDYTERVQPVDPTSTAFPDRFKHYLVSPVIIHFDPVLNDQVVTAGRSLEEIALEYKNGPLNAYVNYAHGDETEEDWYGHESWRIHRLTTLKKKYYAPIKV